MCFNSIIHWKVTLSVLMSAIRIKCIAFRASENTCNSSLDGPALSQEDVSSWSSVTLRLYALLITWGTLCSHSTGWLLPWPRGRPVFWLAAVVHKLLRWLNFYGPLSELESAAAFAGTPSSSRTGSSCSSLTWANTLARTRTLVSIDRKQVPPLVRVAICVFSKGEGHVQLSLTMNKVQKTLEVQP